MFVFFHCFSRKKSAYKSYVIIFFSWWDRHHWWSTLLFQSQCFLSNIWNKGEYINCSTLSTILLSDICKKPAITPYSISASKLLVEIAFHRLMLIFAGSNYSFSWIEGKDVNTFICAHCSLWAALWFPVYGKLYVVESAVWQFSMCIKHEEFLACLCNIEWNRKAL